MFTGITVGFLLVNWCSNLNSLVNPLVTMLLADYDVDGLDD
ncbi:unnamed protein product [marine sediment metagenome]|uniref:Uncharacterized protein n=1 Tax=marine sediment metagenome TaxID=412755 RepID=X1JXL5_9ZZZZ